MRRRLMTRGKIHCANLSGSWYPANPGALRAEIERCLGENRTPDPELRAILAPHAGYRYSGKAAGAAFAKIAEGRWRRAVVIAPSHYHAFAGAAVFAGDGFETPLGVMGVDRAAAAELAARPGFTAAASPYEREHSLEIELPFLQTVDPAIEVVPVLVGSPDDRSSLATVAAGLQGLADADTLFVVSSDFTHYGARFDYLPFASTSPEDVSAKLRRLDFGAIVPVLDGDVEKFQDYVRSTGITVCGRGPITAFLLFAAGRFVGQLADYYTSLDVTGDFEHSVSYAAIVFRPRPGAAR